ncbi:MAG: haloacid dehalogenase type II [Pseudomonadota bacterium]
MVRVTIFDAYGTLFDVNAAARRLSQEPDREQFAEIWEQVARDWRAKQLGYTWLRAVTGAHTDFWRVTEDSLDWALEAAGLQDGEIRARLLDLYRRLEAYPEVRVVLERLKSSRLTTGILSNGSPDMLDAAVEHAGLRDLLDSLLSVEAAGIFKPASRVYDLVGETHGVPADDVLFVSSNGWDAACAKGYGFKTIWVNRGNEPKERLPWTPDWILPDLMRVPEIAAAQ